MEGELAKSEASMESVCEAKRTSMVLKFKDSVSRRINSKFCND